MSGYRLLYRLWPVWGLFWALLSCSGLPAKPEPPRVSLIGLELVSVELLEQRYRVRLRIKNPNAFELPVRGVDFRLDLNGEAFADGVSNRSVAVPAYGEAVVELEVSSNLFQVVRQLQSLQHNEAAVLEYRISGNVATGVYGRTLPFDHAGRLGAPEAAPTPGR